jgi:RNA polymerase sigma-70 factor (ECF subfamily)
MIATHQQNESDRDLIKAVAGEDTAAFERLYRLYEKRVFQYVRTLIDDYSIAEDVVIETMTAVWRGAANYAQTSRVSTWIFGIARHKALDALRKPSSRKENVPLDEIVELPGQVDGPIETMNRTQVASIMQKALKKLSRDHQEIMRLVFYEEMPYEEIASLLSIPENTVKTRVYHAKRQLKQLLDTFTRQGAL